MKKIMFLISFIVCIFANDVVLYTNYNTEIERDFGLFENSVTYFKGKYYSVNPNDDKIEISVFNDKLKFVKKILFKKSKNQKFEVIFPFNNTIYLLLSKKYSKFDSFLYLYKVSSKKVYFIKKINIPITPGSTLYNYNKNFFVISTLKVKNGYCAGGNVYILNKKFHLIRKLSLSDLPSYTYLDNDKFIYILNDIKKINIFDIKRNRKQTLLSFKKPRTAMLVKNILLYYTEGGVGKYFNKYNFTTEQDMQISYQSVGHILWSKSDPYIFLTTAHCPTSSYCCDNTLIFNTKNDAYISNLYHSCRENDFKFKGKFAKINKYVRVLYTQYNKDIGGPYFLTSFYVIDLNAPLSILKKYKRFFITTIENKINKKLSKNVKIVILNDNKWISKEQGTTSYCSIPFIIIDNNKMYFYMNMSFTSINSLNVRHIWNGEYKLIKDKTILANHIYAPHYVNNNNAYLGYNPVFEFSDKFEFKKGMKFKFIENDGKGGSLYFDLIVKDVF